MEFRWDNKYNLPDSNLNSQHKHLFNLCNKYIMIHNLSHNQNELKQIIKELYNYVQIHFRDEELFMKSINYPLLDEHSAKHNAIIEEMTEIVKSSHSIADLSQHLFPFLKKWILEHVQTEDMKIKEFLEKQSSPISNP